MVSGQRGFAGLASWLFKSQKAIPHHVQHWAAGQLTHLNQFGQLYTHWAQTQWDVYLDTWKNKFMNTHSDLWQIFTQWVSCECLTIMTQMKHWTCNVFLSESTEKGFQMCSISIHEQSAVPQLCLMVLFNNCSCLAMWRNPRELICLLIKQSRELRLTPNYFEIKLRLREERKGRD